MTSAKQAAPTGGQLLDLARADLEEWAAVYRERDARVIRARRCGLGVNEITRLSGLAKPTVLRILASS